jgi:hypothetical protein
MIIGMVMVTFEWMLFALMGTIVIMNMITIVGHVYEFHCGDDNNKLLIQ